MVELEIDGKKVEAPEGSMVMHAAEKLGTFIPHFCYHKKLSIAANCRMCLVDIEKAPKAMPACATPVTQGMIVRTKSEKAIKAQKSVMEFLLINHPLDCPICDQGGECQLQDLAVGYGGSSSRYEEEKRVVFHKDIGPLISMEEMSRCIHCTRCVRFGEEIAGQMELGMSNRGEHSEIEAFIGHTVDSELSGNMIDVCPVGALTSKPFRYRARTWELSRRKTISPHDATGTNLIAQVKNNQVMRVVPLENESINECWIADRDRFSYEALASDQRLDAPMIKQGNTWRTVDWQTALEYVVHGLKSVQSERGPQSIGLMASPHSSLEELYLGAKLLRAMGSNNIDTRLRTRDFTEDALRFNGAPHTAVRWLGRSIESLSHLQRTLVVGSNLRKDHPLMALRIRRAVRMGGQLCALDANPVDWAMSVKETLLANPSHWVAALALIAQSVAKAKAVQPPVSVLSATNIMNELLGVNPQALIQATHVAESLMGGSDHKAVLLGNAAAHHPKASTLLALANWIAEQTGATSGYLGEAANTLGAQLVGALPLNQGLNAQAMTESDQVKALLLMGNEPQFDCALGPTALQHIGRKEMVITLSPFKSNMQVSDVLLPVTPFTETPGTFVNAEGRAQSFHAVVKPFAQSRPAWKVLRVLANMMDLTGFDYETIEELRADAIPSDISAHLNNSSFKTLAPSDLAACHEITMADLSVGIYGLDPLVRRAYALQHTADAATDPRAAEYAEFLDNKLQNHRHPSNTLASQNASGQDLARANEGGNQSGSTESGVSGLNGIAVKVSAHV
jgi:NADH-quinone oxidoreductase subunit G